MKEKETSPRTCDHTHGLKTRTALGRGKRTPLDLKSVGTRGLGVGTEKRKPGNPGNVDMRDLGLERVKRKLAEDHENVGTLVRGRVTVTRKLDEDPESVGTLVRG